MARASATTKKRGRGRGGRDLGRAFAVALFALFALVGAIPLGLGVLVRTSFVRNFAAQKTAALIERELGIVARYRVAVQAWPMAIDLEDVVVDASDGKGSFLEVERIGVRPHLFSLLGGELEVGEIEILGPRIRAVVVEGALKNLSYKLPASSGSSGPSRPPFTSLAVTDAHVDVIVDSAHVSSHEVDVDVSAEHDGAYELALRTGNTSIVRTHPMPGRESEDMVDEDVLCRLDARVRLDESGVLVRRLTLRGAADLDPDPNTSPTCDLAEGDWRAVELGLGALRIELPKDGAPLTGIPNVRGRLKVNLPVPLVHRFVDTPWLTGAVGLDVELEHDGSYTLPRVTGRVTAERPGLGGKVFATTFAGDVSIAEDVVRVSKIDITWADGTATIGDVKIRPFADGMPLEAGPIEIHDIQFPGLLRDLGVHPQAHVAWTLEKGRFETFRGKLDPPSLEGPMEISTRGFEVFDKPTTDPNRGHMISVAEGKLRGVFAVRPNGILLDDVSIETPKSELRTRVMLLFKSALDIEIFKGSHVDLSEISPLKNIPLAGVAELSAIARGPFSHPEVDADVSIKGFEFSSFSFGDVESAHAHFEPFDLNLVDVNVRKGGSKIRAPAVHVDFDAGPDVVVDADVDTQQHPHLWVHDFYQIVHLDDDPRFSEIDANASGTARVHFVVGGPEDRCGGGRLRVKTKMHLEEVEAFGERYEDGDIDVDLDWEDREAGAAGMSLDVHSATLRKGSGTVLASLSVRPGGRVTGQAIATGIPIDHLDALGRMGKPLDGSISAVANISGTVSQLEATADVSITPIRIGPSSLPSSELRLLMTSEGTSPHTIGWTRCQNPRTGAFDRAEFDRDVSGGNFRVSGSMAGGQLTLEDVRVTRQKHKVVTGKVKTAALDLGTLANLVPGVAFSATPPRGKLDATIDMKKLPLDDLAKSDLVVSLTGLELERGGRRVVLDDVPGPILVQNNTLSLPDLRVLVESGSGLSAPIVVGGKVDRLVTAPELDFGLRVGPLDLSRLSSDIPQVTRAKGQLAATLRVQGVPSSLRYAGSARLRNGELAVRGLPVSLDDIEVDIAVSSGEARILRGSAKVGGGEVSVTGSVPIRGLELGVAEAAIKARGVKMPVAEGVNLTADADLAVTLKPTPPEELEREGKNLPEVKGTISLTSFTYARPIALSLDLGQLAGGPKRTTVEAYDPKDDVLRFDVVVVSPRPLRFSNNLVDMQLEVTAPGLALSGTNQRYGARGMLRILPDSKLRLRNNEFIVREGSVRFDDPLRFSPKVDVRAQTEYRRYAASGGTQGADTSTSAAATASLGQQWRINLYAHGDEQNLKLDLTSDPSLSQEDIVLLLTVGLTRAEMDRGLASSLGETVGLEALAALTGADKAVKTMVPIIDEFRFGTSYSSRTGRTEPTVTLGKRITDDVRATVTTGITENREIRSSIEWRLGKRVIVQGAYDNTNDVSSSPLGNLGVDLRWRIEFE